MDEDEIMASLQRLRGNANAARTAKSPKRRRELMTSIGLAQLEPEVEIGQAEIESGPQIEMGEAQIEAPPTARIGATQYDDDIRARIGRTQYGR